MWLILKHYKKQPFQIPHKQILKVVLFVCFKKRKEERWEMIFGELENWRKRKEGKIKYVSKTVAIMSC